MSNLRFIRKARDIIEKTVEIAINDHQDGENESSCDVIEPPGRGLVCVGEYIGWRIGICGIFGEVPMRSAHLADPPSTSNSIMFESLISI
jgi:hypothetical protein